MGLIASEDLKDLERGLFRKRTDKMYNYYNNNKDYYNLFKITAISFGFISTYYLIKTVF